MTVAFELDFRAPATKLPHFWEHTIGSDHAPMALRADWRQQLRRAHEELGFRYVRFHGLLCDDVGTLIGEGDKLFFSFFNADQIFDFLLTIGMKPFVELSFMPSVLASGDKTVFHYRANVSAPKDYTQWASLISKLVAHWSERYGQDEVRKWYFEVWNEPNLEAFGSGRLADYLKLYQVTAFAIKAVDPALRVGGPATAANAWIAEFIAHCQANRLPLDFVSTHHYPTDAFGKPGDDTLTQLSLSRRSVLREEARTVREQAGDRPVYYTEWSTSSNPRDALHDEPYAAAFIVKTVLEANGLVRGYSYWTFSDLFEENYFPSVPFHGGFGLLNIHGVAKPAYRAFELLHGLGTDSLPVTGRHATVDAWAVRRDRSLTLILSNFALPRHPIATETVLLRIANSQAPTEASIRRIDANHANPKGCWQGMGSPTYLTPTNIDDLVAASICQPEYQTVQITGNIATLEVAMPPLAVAAITIAFGPE